MKLILKLGNSDEELSAIGQALRRTEIEVVADVGRVVLKWDALPELEVDPGDLSLIRKTWKRVHELIAVINGAGRLEGTISNGVSLLELYYLNSEEKEQFFPGYATCDVVFPVLRSGLPDPSQFVSLGLRNEAAAKALRLFSAELDWVNLYRIYEVIVQDVVESVLIRSEWVTQDEIKAFRGSANNASVTGDFSRHGKMNESAPQLIMSLASSQRLIARLLRTWLYSMSSTSGGST
jgi:hypothetical protein